MTFFLIVLITFLCLFTALSLCAFRCNDSEPTCGKSSDHVRIQILFTSDMHGRFLPYDYLKNCEDYSGSLAQVSSAVKKLRDDSTVIIDVGDMNKGNMDKIFLDDDITPMATGVNAIGYNIAVVGNHAFNDGIETLRKIGSTADGCVGLCGNVFDSNGKPLGDAYLITEIKGIRIGIIGMTTSNIQFWDAENLTGWTVADPVLETKKVIEEIKDKVDVLVAAVHMDIENELGNEHTGVRDLAQECPELDLILASHGHTRIDDLTINNIPVSENEDCARTLGTVEIDMMRSKDKWSVHSIDTSLLEMQDYDPDPELVELLKPYHKKALETASRVIGVLEGGNLEPDDEIPGICQGYLQSTGLTELYNKAQAAVCGADISSVSLNPAHGNIFEGDIRMSDLVNAYMYDNYPYLIEMNGAQLRKWMEWSAGFFNTYHEGDLTISFNPEIRAYNYDMFGGVNYEIDISKNPGERIENLTWPDGTPLKDSDVFTVVASAYRACSMLICYGDIFSEGEDLPRTIDIDFKGKEAVQYLIVGYYIKEYLKGKVTSECTNNWKLKGFTFDEELRQRAIRLVKDGKLTIESTPNGRTPNIRTITVEDVINAENGYT